MTPQQNHKAIPQEVESRQSQEISPGSSGARQGRRWEGRGEGDGKRHGNGDDGGGSGEAMVVVIVGGTHG